MEILHGVMKSTYPLREPLGLLVLAYLVSGRVLIGLHSFVIPAIMAYGNLFRDMAFLLHKTYQYMLGTCDKTSSCPVTWPRTSTRTRHATPFSIYACGSLPSNRSLNLAPLQSPSSCVTFGITDFALGTRWLHLLCVA